MRPFNLRILQGNLPMQGEYYELNRIVFVQERERTAPPSTRTAPPPP